MIDAAEALFLEQGYEQTPLSAVVQRSGGSLATLYENFGNKQGLLRAVMTGLKEDNTVPIPGDPTDVKSCSDQLKDYAHALYAHLMTPRAIALKRIVMTEALRDPCFAKGLYEDLHLSAVDELALSFRKWTDRDVRK